MNTEVPVKKNEHYKMEICDLSNEGVGVGKMEGYTVFVEGCLPGDVADVRIVKVKKNYAFGKLINLITPSKDRVVPECKFEKKCGGCQLQHLSYDAQLKFKTKKVAECIKRIGGFSDVEVMPTIGAKKLYNYRNKCQFPVGKGENGVDIGFYSLRSHSIVNIEGCMIQHEINDEILSTVRKFMDENKISVYDEKTGRGYVRHILTRVGFITGEIMVCIVVNGNELPQKEKLIAELTKIKGMTSIVLNINKKNTNVILGHKVINLWGKGFITDYIGDIKFEISPLSFFQVNPEQTKVLYEKAVEFANLTKDDVVFDIYCGIGTISLFLADKVKKVIGVEIVPEAIEDAKRNAKLNGIDNAEFFAGAAEDVIPELLKDGKKADVVFIDPPRKGCDGAVLDAIVKMNPKKIVYVSCDPATLARDLRILAEGGFTVEKVQPVDQFVMSTHIETVVLLTFDH